MHRFIAIIFGLFLCTQSINLRADSFNTSNISSKIGDSAGEVSFFQAEKVMPGHFAYVAPKAKKIIEIDQDGVITRVFNFPEGFKAKRISGGSDIEWIPSLEQYLITSPTEGVARVNLDGDVAWLCENEFISHDADYINEDDVVFVNAWDDIGADEPIFTRINQTCDVVETLRASELELRKDSFHPDNVGNKGDNSHTHTNAVQLIRPKLIMLSIRNYDEIVIVSLKKREIVRRVKKATWVHDPLVLNPEVKPKRMDFIYADRAKGDRLRMTRTVPDRKRPVEIWNSLAYEPRKDQIKDFRTDCTKRLWSPVRTVEKLPNGNFLVTGSAHIGQITLEGELVWQIRLKGFDNQFKGKDYIYKAAFRPN